MNGEDIIKLVLAIVGVVGTVIGFLTFRASQKKQLYDRIQIAETSFNVAITRFSEAVTTLNKSPSEPAEQHAHVCEDEVLNQFENLALLILSDVSVPRYFFERFGPRALEWLGMRKHQFGPGTSYPSIIRFVAKAGEMGILGHRDTYALYLPDVGTGP